MELARLIEAEGAANVAAIVATVTCNTTGGQPVSLANLRAAKRLGVRTVWVTQYLKMADPIGTATLPKMLKRPAYVDVKVKSVRQLPARLHRLR